MSHFSVAVFTEPGQLDVDALLEPFWEGIEFPRYVDETKAELIARGREESGNVEISDDEAYKRATKYCDPENIDPVTGDHYTTYNPDSKWDWYEVGGRWSKMLIGKDGKPYDSLPVNQIDFDAMRTMQLEQLTPYEEYLDGDRYFTKEYLLSIYPDEQTYIHKMTEFSTFAVLTPDGQWREKGSMGWFGCSGETPEEDTAWHDSYEDAFIKPALEEGWELTVVDCHI